MTHAVIIDYTNWKGGRRERRIMPLAIEYMANAWHVDPQWLLLAMDLEMNQKREFALKDIHSWKPVVPLTEGERIVHKYSLEEDVAADIDAALARPIEITEKMIDAGAKVIPEIPAWVVRDILQVALAARE